MKTTYTIPTPEGDKTVTGTTYREAPGLAVHRAGACNWPVWIVSHIGSGMALGAGFHKRKVAKAFILAVAMLVDWKQTAKQLNDKIDHGSKLAQKMRAIRREYARQ